jgi:Flp pilus assembly pilin Flp
LIVALIAIAMMGGLRTLGGGAGGMWTNLSSLASNKM